MDLFVGTNGFSYKAWKGSFYPEALAAGDMLRFYSSRLPCVEINNTFYRMPKRSEAPTAEAVSAGRHAYLRLRRDAYADADLALFADRLRAAGPERTFVFFEHELQGPQLAAHLSDLSARPRTRAAKVCGGRRRVREAG